MMRNILTIQFSILWLFGSFLLAACGTSEEKTTSSKAIQSKSDNSQTYFEKNGQIDNNVVLRSYENNHSTTSQPINVLQANDELTASDPNEITGSFLTMDCDPADESFANFYCRLVDENYLKVDISPYSVIWKVADQEATPLEIIVEEQSLDSNWHVSIHVLNHTEDMDMTIGAEIEKKSGDSKQKGKQVAEKNMGRKPERSSID
jgi:hypothetical protein